MSPNLRTAAKTRCPSGGIWNKSKGIVKATFYRDRTDNYILPSLFCTYARCRSHRDICTTLERTLNCLSLLLACVPGRALPPPSASSPVQRAEYRGYGPILLNTDIVTVSQLHAPHRRAATNAHRSSFRTNLFME